MSNSSFAQQLRWVAILCAALGAIEVINFLTGRSLSGFGLIPREPSSLYGVITAPFLHSSVQHFLCNIVPLAVLTTLLLQYGQKRYILVTAGVIAGSGLLVWLFARPAIHIGASGVIFGYVSFLIVAGLRRQQIKHLLISIFVLFSYGGLLWGVLPTAAGVSFEYHLFGAIVGAALGMKPVR